MNATTTTIDPMTAADLLREIEARGISLTGWPRFRIWIASVERVRSKKRFTKPDMEVVSATATTPVEAVTALLAILDGEPQHQELEETY